MSILSKIGKLFSKLLSSVLKFLKKYWWVILLVVVVLAVFFPLALPAIMTYVSTAWTAVSGWVGTAFTSLTSWAGAAFTAAQTWVSEASFGDVLKVAAGAAVLLNPEGIADAAGSLLSKVVKAIPSAVWWIGGAVAAFWLFGGERKENQTVVVVPEGKRGDV